MALLIDHAPADPLVRADIATAAAPWPAATRYDAAPGRGVPSGRTMRGMIMACVAALAGCKGSTTSGPGPSPIGEVAKTAPPVALPTAARTAPLDARVAAFVYLDAHGGRGAGVLPGDGAATWAYLPARTAEEFRQQLRTLQDAIALGRPRADLARAFAMASPTPPVPGPTDAALPPDALAVAIAQEAPTAPTAPVPAAPPAAELPPPPADVPEEALAMTLDEDKLAADEPLAAIAPPRSDAAFAGQGVDAPPTPTVPVAERQQVGGIAWLRQPRSLRLAVLADRGAPAPALVGLLAEVPGLAALVVATDAGLARSTVLFGLDRRGGLDREDVAIDLDADGAHVRGPHGAPIAVVPWRGDELDGPLLAAAVTRAVPPTGVIHGLSGGLPPIFLGVTPAVNVQRVVAVLDALGPAKLTVVVLRTWARPALHGAYVFVDQPIVDGDLDPGPVRRALRAQAAGMRACVAAAPREAPLGTLDVRFTIGRDGRATVPSAGAPGSAPACIAALIRGVGFPAPNSRGTARVDARIDAAWLP